MDEKTRRQMEQAALARIDKEREERRRKEEAERQRKKQEHERFLMQQRAIEKQNAHKKLEELEIAKRNDAMMDELERQKEAQRLREAAAYNSIFGED